MTSRLTTIVNGRPTIEIGALRHQVTFLTQHPSSGVSGSKVSYQPSSPPQTAMCAIDATRGSDVMKDGQVTAQLYLMIALWWQSGIVNNMHVLHANGSEYVVQNVENVLEMDVVLVLTCVALGANQ